MTTDFRKPPQLFYIIAGLLTIGALFATGFYMMNAIEGGVLAWWAYGPLTLYMIALFTLEQVLFGGRRR